MNAMVAEFRLSFELQSELLPSDFAGQIFKLREFPSTNMLKKFNNTPFFTCLLYDKVLLNIVGCVNISYLMNKYLRHFLELHFLSFISSFFLYCFYLRWSLHVMLYNIIIEQCLSIHCDWPLQDQVFQINCPIQGFPQIKFKFKM